MVIIKLQGGLGNQMFQYALGRHLAIKNKMELKIDLSFLLDRTPRKNFTLRDYNLYIFNIQEKFATKYDIKKVVGFLPSSFYGRLVNKLYYIFKKNILPDVRMLEKQHNFSPDILDLHGNLYLDGYWQTEKYFKDISNTIKKDFSFKNLLTGYTLGLVQKILKTESVFISVRRGDYVTDLKVNKRFGVLDSSYYQRAIKYIAEKIDNPEFFIFSDDIDWCIRNFNINYKHTFVKYEHGELKFCNDMHLMSLCKHSIVSNSTFAWWGAWLNNNPDKIVIAPRKWFTDKSINIIDVIPDNWIKL
jgi:hypothetical protein